MTWRIERAISDEGAEGFWVSDDYCDSVCDLYTYDLDKQGKPRHMVPFPNAQENAQLIAAAPELLSLLGEIRDRINSYGLVTWMDRRFWNRVDEVLEKATGVCNEPNS